MLEPSVGQGPNRDERLAAEAQERIVAAVDREMKGLQDAGWIPRFSVELLSEAVNRRLFDWIGTTLDGMDSDA